MSAQQDRLMEELTNRGFTVSELYGIIFVYEKEDGEVRETVSVFTNTKHALHEHWDKNGMMIDSSYYNTEVPQDVEKLLNSCG